MGLISSSSSTSSNGHSRAITIALAVTAGVAVAISGIIAWRYYQPTKQIEIEGDSITKKKASKKTSRAASTAQYASRKASTSKKSVSYILESTYETTDEEADEKVVYRSSSMESWPAISISEVASISSMTIDYLEPNGEPAVTITSSVSTTHESLNGDMLSPPLSPLDNEQQKITELVKRARELRVKGNTFYAEKKLKEASEIYTMALETVEPARGSGSKEADSEVLTSLINRAACHLGLQNPGDAERDCTAALLIDGLHVKALDRRCKARSEIFAKETNDSVRESIELGVIEDAMTAAAVDKFTNLAFVERVEALVKEIGQVRALRTIQQREEKLGKSEESLIELLSDQEKATEFMKPLSHFLLAELYASSPVEIALCYIEEVCVPEEVSSAIKSRQLNPFEATIQMAKYLKETTEAPLIGRILAKNHIGGILLAAGYRVAGLELLNLDTDAEMNPYERSAAFAGSLWRTQMESSYGTPDKCFDELEVAAQLCEGTPSELQDLIQSALEFHRGEASALVGALSEAVDLFRSSTSRVQKVKSYFPEACEAYVTPFIYMIRALLAAERLDEAQKFLETVVKPTFPDHPEVINCDCEMRALTAASKEEIRAHFEKMLSKYSGAQPRLLLNNAMLIVQTIEGDADEATLHGEIHRAVQHIRSALDIDPAFIAARIQLTSLIASFPRVLESLGGLTKYVDESMPYARNATDLVGIITVQLIDIVRTIVCARHPQLSKDLYDTTK